MRGKRAIASNMSGPAGLIPAYAGKTPSAARGKPFDQAHPRVCGENYRPDAETLPTVGSSPRVRGKLQALKDTGLTERIIPACAGKTSPKTRRLAKRRDHPRVCGENSTALDADSTASGSSPRVRGKHGRWVLRPVNEGIIPACAGKTKRSFTSPVSGSDHPRVCGENLGLSSR